MYGTLPYTNFGTMFKQVLPTELQIAPAEDGREGPACQLGR